MRKLFLLPFVWLLCDFTMWSQTDSASLSGRVTDPSGAAIVGADVTVTNTATGVSNRMKTNEAGVYNFSVLSPGSFRLTVRSTGFQQVQRDDLVLHVQDRISANVALPIGSSDQTVIVTGESSLVNTESAVVGTVVSRDFVANLPLNGRSIQSLITLTPGVVVTNVSSGSPGQFSMNGQRPDSNYFTVDGVSANISVGAGASVLAGASGSGVQPSSSGGFSNLASIDAIQEFKIQPSTF